jgi:3-oxoacyl-[acyl-carrier-protein] synthase II
MAVLAAAGAMNDAAIEGIGGKKVGIILATAFGAHVTTFDFLDGILDFGEANASPTAFSNSVHNAAASYVSSALDLKGPTLTVTSFRLSFPSALQLAQGWLEQGRCDYLLVGCAEQYGNVLGHVTGRKLNRATDGIIRPFTFAPTAQVPGEGGVFFLLGRETTPESYCALEGVTTTEPRPSGDPADLQIIACDGMLQDESLILAALDRERPVTGFAPLYGSSMGGSAFSVACGALMLKQQRIYAAPEQTNPHGLPLGTTTATASLGRVRCFDGTCRGEVATISLVAR